MLLLDSRTMEFDGVTVFPDHADPQQFYYMPLAPHLTVRRDSGGAEFPQFSLIRFKGEAGTGGFLNFDVNLALPPDRFARIKSAIQRAANLRDEPQLAPIPVVDGTVHLLMLGADSSVDPEDAPTPAAGAIHFVETISHAAKPGLFGDNQAAFSVQLSEEGITTVLQSIEGEILPIAVVYSLQYLGLRPAYSVRLNINWDRVQKHMDESFGANLLFLSADIGKAVDDLVEQRAITFEADSFIDDTDESSSAVAGRRDAAIAQVKAMITDAFFQPSLPPYVKGQGDGWSKNLQKAADVIGLIAGGPGAAATSKSLFSYSKMEYERTDKKSLNVNFSERTTVKRSIYPQGHLAGLFEALRAPGIDRSRFITSVDLDDPWFKRRRLLVFAQTDFDGDRISAINVRARYNNEPKNAILKKGTSTATFDWTSQLDGNTMKMPIELSYEITFDGADTTERPRTLASPPETEDGEQRGIDPRTLYALSPVPIVAVNFPWERYPMVEVHVRYTDPANSLAEAELFRLTKDHSEDLWPIFILDLARRSFEYRFIFRGADNRNHKTVWTTTEDEAVTVTDPFPRKREFGVAVAFNWQLVDRVFVDVTYRDDANDVDEQKSLEFIAGDRSKSVVFEMQDPHARLVGYSGIILNKDGTSAEIPPSVSNAPRAVITPNMKGHKVVEVRPPADFAAQRLTRVAVDLSFEDFAAGLQFKDNLVFEPGGGSQFFEYDYANPTRDRYQHQISYLFDNGMQRVLDPEAGDAALIQLKAP